MDRYRRFAEVCKQHKCKITAIDAGSKILNFQSGPTIWKKYISHFDGIDGLFTADVTAAACMKMLQKKGLRFRKTEGGWLRRPGFYPLFDTGADDGLSECAGNRKAERGHNHPHD